MRNYPTWDFFFSTSFEGKPTRPWAFLIGFRLNVPLFSRSCFLGDDDDDDDDDLTLVHFPENLARAVVTRQATINVSMAENKIIRAPRYQYARERC